MAGGDFMASGDFLDEFFHRRRRDGPDFRVLDRLAPHEREPAIDLLLAAARQGDIPSIQGLAHLRADRAAEPVRGIMHEYDGVVRVYAAAALFWLRRDAEALEMLCREAVHRPRW